MKLYGFTASPNTWKVRALAAHLKIPLDYQLIDLTKGAQFAPDYLALNPTGRTPTLVDGDFTLWESCAIMQYIASKQPRPCGRMMRAAAPISRAGKLGYSRIGARKPAGP